ncbi:tyrosine-type recombinase/integrase, partial [Nocardia sp. NPDC059154]|uniref:tyrosine-type recombinase/integrase n=1 Tax=Nocardia sp. NPDC059154 TaxID=3346744 RepID=UPI00367DEF6A
MGVARRFCAWLATLDPATEIPPTGIFPTHRHRPAPYLWSPQDIERLIGAARALNRPLHATTLATLFGLLAATGMRIGEAVALRRADVDLDTGIITIHHAKLDRDRLVPLHPRT